MPAVFDGSPGVVVPPARAVRRVRLGEPFGGFVFLALGSDAAIVGPADGGRWSSRTVGTGRHLPPVPASPDVTPAAHHERFKEQSVRGGSPRQYQWKPVALKATIPGHHWPPGERGGHALTRAPSTPFCGARRRSGPHRRQPSGLRRNRSVRSSNPLSAACRRCPGPRTHRSACSRSRKTPH